MTTRDTEKPLCLYRGTAAQMAQAYRPVFTRIKNSNCRHLLTKLKDACQINAVVTNTYWMASNGALSSGAEIISPVCSILSDDETLYIYPGAYVASVTEREPQRVARFER